MTINKKGQEEMVGFVLIVIMVIVMGLVLLVIMRPKIETKKDLQADNLLNSLLESTEAGKAMKDLIENCIRGIDCDGTSAALNARMNASLAKSGYVLGKTLNGYILTAGKENNIPINISSGKFAGNSITSLVPLQNADVTLKFYY